MTNDKPQKRNKPGPPSGYRPSHEKDFLSKIPKVRRKPRSVLYGCPEWKRFTKLVSPTDPEAVTKPGPIEVILSAETLQLGKSVVIAFKQLMWRYILEQRLEKQYDPRIASRTSTSGGVSLYLWKLYPMRPNPRKL